MNKKKRRPRTGKRARQNRKLIVLTGIGVVLAVLFVIAMTMWLYVSTGRVTQEQEQEVVVGISVEEQSIREIVYVQDSIVDKIVNGGVKVSKALSQRPETVEITAEEAEDFGTLSCEISGSSSVDIKISSEGIPASDDKYYYLFEMATYEDGLAEDAEPISKMYKGDDASFTIKLNKGQANSRLFSKFAIAVKMEDKYVPVAHAKYITNPEECAAYYYDGMDHDSIKGILPYPLRLDELTDLGVNYAAYNIPLSHILTTSGGISYTYGGVTYHFNERIINDYDTLFKKLNGMGIDIAAIVLNDASTSAYPEITHPSARSGSTAPYYMFNATNDSGVKALAAIGSFLAGRYSGSGHGNVSMWIIANEVNARREYNYMSYTDVNTYTTAFTRAFRVFYNAIKSQNAGALVYIPLDQRWTYNTESTGDYDAKDVLDIFASSMNDYGNVNWGLAAHPYSFPNDNTAFWKTSKYVNHTESTPCITMENIEVLTNYMQKTNMLNPNGDVRSIILSEIGYSSTQGENLQAAAFAYAYTKMVQNGYIDALMLSRQVDAPEEIAALGLALGLETSSGSPKHLYFVFKYIDDPDKRDEVCAFAYDIIGKKF